MKTLIRALMIGILAFSGCSKKESNPSSSQHLLVCSPFGAGINTSDHGLVADVYSFSNSLITQVPSSTWSSISVLDLQTAGTKLDVSVFLPDLSVVPTWFEGGLRTPTGEYVRAPGGTVLTQYFSLHISGKIRLPDGASPGLYQFALLADDGAILKLDTGSGPELVVDDNGVHESKFGCGSTAVAFDRSIQVPFTVDYFQGPPNMIALSLLWRRVGDVGSTPDLTDSACGHGSDAYFFDVSPGSSIAKDTWKSDTGGVLSRWEVVPASAYTLPSDVGPNPCAN